MSCRLLVVGGIVLVQPGNLSVVVQGDLFDWLLQRFLPKGLLFLRRSSLTCHHLIGGILGACIYGGVLQLSFIFSLHLGLLLHCL